MSGPVNVIRFESAKKAKLKTYRVFVDRKELEEHLLDALALVEGREVSWPGKNDIVVNGLELWKSGKGPGGYAILNCACGSGAGCVGLDDQIEVLHKDDFIIWNYKAPDIGEKKSDRIFSFTFHKPQYLKALSDVEPANNLEGLPRSAG